MARVVDVPIRILDLPAVQERIAELERERDEWEARALAHARALSSILATSERRPGTFGAQWYAEAHATVEMAAAHLLPVASWRGAA